VIRDLVCHLPVMVTPKWEQSRSAPVALENLLTYLVRVAELPEAEGQILDAGGPDFLGYEAMKRQFADCVGRRPFIIRVPVLTPNLSSRWLGLVTSVPTNITRALIQGLEYDIPAKGDALARLVPQRLLGFRESVEAALNAEGCEADVGGPWVDGDRDRTSACPTLSFDMKTPGAGVLEFELEEIDEKTRLIATAYWHPAGVWGLLCWYSLVPLHVILFEGMTKTIARQAELSET